MNIYRSEKERRGSGRRGKRQYNSLLFSTGVLFELLSLLLFYQMDYYLTNDLRVAKEGEEKREAEVATHGRSV